MTAELRNDVSVTLALIAAGMRSRSGTGLMSLLAVLSFTVATWVALVVVGGTGMFLSRWREQPDFLDERLASLDFVDVILQMYVFMALFACAFLGPVL